MQPPTRGPSLRVPGQGSGRVLTNSPRESGPEAGGPSRRQGEVWRALPTAWSPLRTSPGVAGRLAGVEGPCLAWAPLPPGGSRASQHCCPGLHRAVSLQGQGCWGLRARLGRERGPKTILRPALLPGPQGRQPSTNRGAPGCLGEQLQTGQLVRLRSQDMKAEADCVQPRGPGLLLCVTDGDTEALRAPPPHIPGQPHPVALLCPNGDPSCRSHTAGSLALQSAGWASQGPRALPSFNCGAKYCAGLELSRQKHPRSQA